MNETDSTVTLPNGTEVITTAHLVLIAILIVAAILVIWWGSRRRARERAEREERGLDKTNMAAERVAAVPPTTSPPPPLVDEPPMAAAAPVEAPAAVSRVPPRALSNEASPATPDAGQSVTVLKGLGPKVAARLADLGVTTIGQLAALSPAEAEALDGELGAFRGRMARDRWIEQARLLEAGDRVTYEATFGKLG